MPHYPPMRFLLQTQRLLLRPWTWDDIAIYCELIAERGQGTPSTDSVRAKIEAQHAHARKAGIALLATQWRFSGEVIGYCGLTVGRATMEEPEIAFELLRRAQGQGCATEAAGAVIEAATLTGRQRLWATIRAGNAASRRVVDKLGFHRDRVTWDQNGEIVWLTRSL